MTLTTLANTPNESVPNDLTVAWFFRTKTTKGMEVVKWDWRSPPPVENFAPVRMPRSGANNRHIPASVFSMTNGDVVHLESGLEHDLFRKLDRDPEITFIGSQPLRLSWVDADHIPDLLTVHRDTRVTVWDVRADDEQDADFAYKSGITRDACAAVGWRYEVFAGYDTIERLNLMWLTGFRQRPEWADRHERTIRDVAGTGPVTVGSLFGRDDGNGELKAVVWHLIWSGVLDVDMAAAWDLDTEIVVSGATT